MGVFLFFCGVSQLVNALVMPADYRLVVVSLLASIACWGAMITLVPLLARVPITGDVEGYEREIAERQRAEVALLNSEAAARKLAEADAQERVSGDARSRASQSLGPNPQCCQGHEAAWL